jgi:uncharacterized short protein YbdD (DUF466 family)
MTIDGLRRHLHEVAAVLRRIIGVPDYDTYLAHVRTAHPGREPMSKEEFERCRLEAKYSRPGQRCC